jgi:hypothetical protein
MSNNYLSILTIHVRYLKNSRPSEDLYMFNTYFYCKLEEALSTMVLSPFLNVYNNNNQVFYSQVSWGRLEMKPHEPKKKKKQVQNKNEKKGKIKGDKKSNQQKEKNNKMLSQKSKKKARKKT